MSVDANGAIALDKGSSSPKKTSPKKSRWLEVLGPGLITGASDDDPSGIATYSQTGAQFGYATSWTLVLTYPLMAAVQIISARVGRTTGQGIAGNLREHYPAWLVHGIVGLVLAANIVNIGADLSAMGDGVNLLVGGPHILYVIAFGIISIGLQVFVTYKNYVRYLKWLTLVLFAYVATLFLVRVDWPKLAVGMFVPKLSSDAAYITAIVAIFGTTISPYLFFWQSSQEVEEIEGTAERKPLVDAPRQAEDAKRRIRLDTLVGMAFSNLIALAIMVATAATLNANGVTHIETSAQAAAALKPIAGSFATVFFTLGIIGTGLLAIPVLGGSAAYAVGEVRGWPTGLARKPREAKAFYATIAIATLLGIALNFTSISPMNALYWSAVVNGIVAVPVMVLLMLMGRNAAVMGDFPIGGALVFFGWLATGVMALAALAMGVTSFL